MVRRGFGFWAALRAALQIGLFGLWLGHPALAQEAPRQPELRQPELRQPELGGAARLTGPARLEPLADRLRLALPLTQPVPFRARLFSNPWRIALDFRHLDWTGLGLAAEGPPGTALRALRHGEAGGGWSRLVLELDRPMGIETLGLTLDPASGQARLELQLATVLPGEFERQRRLLDPHHGAVAQALGPARERRPNGALVVVIDPGHGGVDPGAVAGSVTEAGLMLTFARELAETLRREPGIEAVLTRNEDAFVSLEARITRAREAGGDVFLSLHADALEDGEASGATIYTLADAASDAASAALAERHDRDDLLGGGADFTGAGDEIVLMLLEVARTETRPRTLALAGALVGAIRDADLRMHRRPHQEAAFSVLKSPDIPSVLIELGFLSSERDRNRLLDPAWRARMASALVAGILAWRDAEAAAAPLRRQ